MKVQVGPVEVELDPRGDGVCARVTRDGAFEPASLEAWARLCARGRKVVDVGAYTGLYAIAAALLGCEVVAFEPMPLNADRLQQNADRNGVRDRITLLRVALSDCCGFANINHNPGSRLTSAASLVNAKRRSGRKQVAVATLDSYGLGDVAAIKIDVERAEPEVLRGAARTLARCRPVLLVEVLGDPEKAAVWASLPDYDVTQQLDRNWLMVPQ